MNHAGHVIFPAWPGVAAIGKGGHALNNALRHSDEARRGHSGAAVR